jgi:hypothetical protein
VTAFPTARARRPGGVSRLRLGGAFAVLAGAVVACSGASSGQSDLDTLTDRVAVPTFQVGAVDDPAFAFTRIGGVRAGPDGNVYVLEPAEGRIAVIDPAGDLVGRIGRRGQGPGEFLGPASLGWHADTLWVLDVGTRRVTWLFHGGLVRTLPYGSLNPGEGRTLSTVVPLADGSLLGVASRAPAVARAASNHDVALVRVGPEGGQVTTLGTLRESWPLWLYIGNTTTAAPFHDFPLLGLDPDRERVLVVDRPFPEETRGGLRITALTPVGDTLFALQYDVAARPLTDADWEARLRWREEANPNSVIDRGTLEHAARRPAAHAPASAVVPTSDGGFWLAREDVEGSPTREWVAFDATGHPRYRVQFPRGFRVHDARGDHVWGVDTGEFSVPLVTGYTLERR